MSIGIIDYGMANLRSVQKAFEAVGVAAQIVAEPEQFELCDRLVLPGVGAFKDAIATVRSKHFDEPILNHIAAGRPFLGICLGLQLLFETGYEDGEHRGLGILRGDVVRFDVDRTAGLKVPHMGWNELLIAQSSPLFDGLGPRPHAYFVHSYHVRTPDASIIATTTDYGGEFVSSIRKKNLLGVQFHPEKSQQVGLTILSNFAKFAP
jgi:imidazole glycerol-phosphate synthase subunit HisH